MPTLRSTMWLMVLGGALVGMPLSASAQHEILRWTVDGGGSSAATGGNYTLSGTAGQADAGDLQSTTYEIRGGFWVSPSSIPVSVPDPGDEPEAALQLAIYPPLPNPTRAGAQIGFQLPGRRHAEVRVYNVRGELVRTLIKASLAAGPHRKTWDMRDNSGRSVVSGIYFVRVQLGETVKTHRLTVIR